mmetsp:Transcript_9738/g.14736  ORF Transcript_9738/g.14736 Transcript_9738/m.14736 type:complete len:225 (-) Transcript_9738:82-756(-)
MNRDQFAILLALLSAIFISIWLLCRIKSLRVVYRGSSLVIPANFNAIEAPVWLTSILDNMLQHDNLNNQHFDTFVKEQLKMALSNSSVIRDFCVDVHCGSRSPHFVILNSHTNEGLIEGSILASYSGDARFSLRGRVWVFSTVWVPFEVRLSRPRISCGLRLHVSSAGVSDTCFSLHTTPAFSFDLRSNIGGRFGISDSFFLHCVFTYLIVWKLRQFIQPLRAC